MNSITFTKVREDTSTNVPTVETLLNGTNIIKCPEDISIGANSSETLYTGFKIDISSNLAILAESLVKNVLYDTLTVPVNNDEEYVVTLTNVASLSTTIYANTDLIRLTCVEIVNPQQVSKNMLNKIVIY